MDNYEKIISDEVKKTIEVLRAGGIILYPTDTVWGIGCDATNAEAVEKIYKINSEIPNTLANKIKAARQLTAWRVLKGNDIQ